MAPRAQPDAGAAGRRPRSAWVSAGKRRPRQGPGVCWKGAAGGKCDPSRGDAAHGTRAGGRGGRGGPPGCAGGAPGRRGPSGAGRQRGRRASSRRGRGRTTRRRRTVGGTRGRVSRGEARPRRRSSRGGLRLDNRAQPWHKCTGRPVVSERWAVTRVRGSRPGPHSTPEFSPVVARLRRPALFELSGVRSRHTCVTGAPPPARKLVTGPDATQDARVVRIPACFPLVRVL